MPEAQKTLNLNAAMKTRWICCKSVLSWEMSFEKTSFPTSPLGESLCAVSKDHQDMKMPHGGVTVDYVQSLCVVSKDHQDMAVALKYPMTIDSDPLV